MTAALGIHRVVSIRQTDRAFGSFHCAAFVITDERGVEFEITLYSAEPVEIHRSRREVIDYAEMDAALTAAYAEGREDEAEAREESPAEAMEAMREAE